MRFSSLKVKDFLQSARYLKYYDLDHVIKYCAVSIEEDACCGRCGTIDHKKRYGKSKKQICISYSKKKLKCTKQEDCLFYKIVYQRLQKNIDYGDLIRSRLYSNNPDQCRKNSNSGIRTKRILR